MINNSKNSMFSGVVWSFAAKIMPQIISFVVSVILARILMPEEYGMVSLLLVFINIANVFVTSGFGDALILHKNVTDSERNTLFCYNFSFAMILYIGLFLLAPWISVFYEMPTLTQPLRVLALLLPIYAVITIQDSVIFSRMEFQKHFISTLLGTIVSGGIGIYCAYAGYGVWALVFQHLSNIFIRMVVLLFLVQWKPGFRFSPSTAKPILKDAWRLMGASLINAVYSEMRGLIIGKRYSSADLAYYNKGQQFPTLIISNIDASVSQVIFPALAKKDAKELTSLGRQSLRFSGFITFPLILGLMAVSEPLIILVLTEKWSPAIPFLRLSCLYFLCQPVQTATWQMIKASKYTEVCLRLEVIKKIIGFTLIILSIPYGATAIAVGNTLVAVCSMLVNMISCAKYTGYSLTEQCADTLPSLIMSACMGILVYLPSLFLALPYAALLVVQVITGICIYVVLAAVSKNKEYQAILQIVKEKICSRR